MYTVSRDYHGVDKKSVASSCHLFQHVFSSRKSLFESFDRIIALSTLLLCMTHRALGSLHLLLYVSDVRRLNTNLSLYSLHFLNITCGEIFSQLY